jgi:hypothetical protein
MNAVVAILVGMSLRDRHAPEQGWGIDARCGADGASNRRRRRRAGVRVLSGLLGGAGAEAHELPRDLELVVFLAHPLELHLEEVRRRAPELPAQRRPQRSSEGAAQHLAGDGEGLLGHPLEHPAESPAGRRLREVAHAAHRGAEEVPEELLHLHLAAYLQQLGRELDLLRLVERAVDLLLLLLLGLAEKAADGPGDVAQELLGLLLGLALGQELLEGYLVVLALVAQVGPLVGLSLELRFQLCTIDVVHRRLLSPLTGWSLLSKAEANPLEPRRTRLFADLRPRACEARFVAAPPKPPCAEACFARDTRVVVPPVPVGELQRWP